MLPASVAAPILRELIDASGRTIRQLCHFNPNAERRLARLLSGDSHLVSLYFVGLMLTELDHQHLLHEAPLSAYFMSSDTV